MALRCFADFSHLVHRAQFYIYGSGNYRAVFESALSVSITTRLAMTTTLTINRNSDPGDDVKKNDILFVTGLTFKID